MNQIDDSQQLPAAADQINPEVFPLVSPWICNWMAPTTSSMNSRASQHVINTHSHMGRVRRIRLATYQNNRIQNTMQLCDGYMQ